MLDPVIKRLRVDPARSVADVLDTAHDISHAYGKVTASDEKQFVLFPRSNAGMKLTVSASEKTANAARIVELGFKPGFKTSTIVIFVVASPIIAFSVIAIPVTIAFLVYATYKARKLADTILEQCEQELLPAPVSNTPTV